MTLHFKGTLICHITSSLKNREKTLDHPGGPLCFSLFPWSRSISAGTYGHTAGDAVTSSHSPRTPICYHNLQYSLGTFNSSLRRHIVKDAMLDPTASHFVWWEFCIWIADIPDKEMHRKPYPRESEVRYEVRYFLPEKPWKDSCCAVIHSMNQYSRALLWLGSTCQLCHPRTVMKVMRSVANAQGS